MSIVPSPAASVASPHRPAGRSPRLRAELERIAGERLAAQREVERIYRREFLRATGECIAWCLAGCVLLLYAAHMTNPGLAQIPWWGGFLVGYGGMSYALISAYNRGIERGDW